LPYAYTQDRVVPLPAEEQRQRLLFSDLREAVYVNEGFRPPTAGASADASGPADSDAFARLQAQNRIVRMDQGTPNRTIIEAEIRVPAMLVIAECWHPGWRATVDGRPTPVQRVNYLQQGVRLEAGRHTVRLRFFPRSVVYGAWATALSWLVFAGILAAGATGHRRREAGTST
jgi:hypothetical protein